MKTMKRPTGNVGGPSARSIGHDLKTPLTGIQMVLRLLEDGTLGPLNERQQKMVEQANRDCVNLVEKINHYVEGEEDGEDEDPG